MKSLAPIFVAGAHRGQEKSRVTKGESQAGQGDHPEKREFIFFKKSRCSTYIPSSTKNSFSFRISGLPQPPAISGILKEDDR